MLKKVFKISVLTITWKWKSYSLSRVWLSVTPGTAARQAPLSMGFSRQEYRSGLPFPPLGHLPDLGIEPELRVLYHWRHLGSPTYCLNSKIGLWFSKIFFGEDWAFRSHSSLGPIEPLRLKPAVNQPGILLPAGDGDMGESCIVNSPLRLLYASLINMLALPAEFLPEQPLGIPAPFTSATNLSLLVLNTSHEYFPAGNTSLGRN